MINILEQTYFLTNPLFLSIQQPLSRGMYYQNTVVLIGCFWKLDIGAHQTLRFQNLTDNLLQTILLTIYILIIVTHICSTHVLQISMVSPVPFQECTEDHTQWLRWRAGSDWHCASQRPPQRWFGDCCQKLKLQKIASKKIDGSP